MNCVETIEVYIRRDETGYYYAEIPRLPGVTIQGRTVQECMENVKEAVELALEDEQDRRHFGISGDVMLRYIVEEGVHVG